MVLNNIVIKIVARGDLSLNHYMNYEFKIYSFISKDLVNVIGTKITILMNSYIHFDYFYLFFN